MALGRMPGERQEGMFAAASAVKALDTPSTRRGWAGRGLLRACTSGC